MKLHNNVSPERPRPLSQYIRSALNVIRPAKGEAVFGGVTLSGKDLKLAKDNFEKFKGAYLTSANGEPLIGQALQDAALVLERQIVQELRSSELKTALESKNSTFGWKSALKNNVVNAVLLPLTLLVAITFSGPLQQSMVSRAIRGEQKLQTAEGVRYTAPFGKADIAMATGVNVRIYNGTEGGLPTEYPLYKFDQIAISPKFEERQLTALGSQYSDMKVTVLSYTYFSRIDKIWRSLDLGELTQGSKYPITNNGLVFANIEYGGKTFLAAIPKDQFNTWMEKIGPLLKNEWVAA